MDFFPSNMELLKCLSVCVLFVVADAGGHGEKHHDHVKLHMPEFIHHDHHTKVITIHHHHHKPKKEHHHHHHHHHKPHIPHHGHGHHYHHKKTATHSVSKGHSTHGHGHHGHHGHHSHHGHHHGHHGHERKHHDPTPSYNYDPPSYEPPATSYDPSPSYGHDYTPFTPSIPNIPNAPHIHGVVHTVKQVKVFDSLPGALPGPTGGTGYQVTEEGNDSDEDVFTSVNSLPQAFSGTLGYVRSAAPEQHDPFAGIPQQGTFQAPNHDPFAAAPQPTSFQNLENFSNENDHISSLATAEGLPPASASAFTSNGGFEDTNINEFDDPSNIIVGNDIGDTAYISSGVGNDKTPVSFNREAGIERTVKSGGIETVVY